MTENKVIRLIGTDDPRLIRAIRAVVREVHGE